METCGWKLMQSIAGTKEHGLLYRGEYKGRHVQAEIITPKRKNGTFGKEKHYFFIVNDGREFATEEELKAAIDAEESVNCVDDIFDCELPVVDCPVKRANEKLLGKLKLIFDAWEAWSTCLAPQEAIDRYYGELREVMEEAKELEGQAHE